MAHPGDDDLLFGVTALELGFISQADLAAATAALAGARLRDRLCSMNALKPAEAEAIAAVVRERLARFNGDVRQAMQSTGTAKQAPALSGGEATTAIGDSFATRSVTEAHDRFSTQAPQAWSYSPQNHRFTVLRLHQQGGLGRLMIARDEELQREIALKEILPAYADNEENRRRFVREAEITGALEHPGVVPVYSLGAHSDGRPFYAMRLIRGVNLRTAIEDFHHRSADRAEAQLEFRQLLARFISVCQAVDYAHHRGVIHRDLKPGNIMLGDYGETLVVDWGLAKPVDERPETDDFLAPAVSPSNRAHSDRTQDGRIVGTTQYMSPEQAAGRIDLVAPASDIYGLGATLYHLVTGHPAFDLSHDDVVLRVQQGRFPRPRERRTDVPRPLEAICLKAMSQKPENRYPTARELALDVERFLGDERVLAYAEPPSARAWRWVRRHRAPVMSFMAAASILVVALSFGVGLLKVQRDRAERNFALAQQAVQDYFIRVSEETLLNQPGMQSLRDALLRQALDYYEQFLKERQHDASLQREVAQANFYVGRITETLESPIKALPHFESAAAVQERLLAGSGEHDFHQLKSQYAQSLNAIGRVHQNLERLAEARRYYEQAADLRQEVASAAPKDVGAARELASTLMNLGLIELAVGDAAGALEFLERAQALRLAHADEGSSDVPLQRDLGMGYYNSALAHLAVGNPAAARINLQGAIEAFSQLADQLPGDLDNRRRLAISHRILGDVQAAAGDVDAAIESHRTARAALEQLSADNPDVAAYAADLAGVQMNLAQQLYETGDRRRALEEVQAAVTTLRKLLEREAALPRQHRDLGVALRFAGQLLAEENQVEAAQSSLEESKELLQALVRQHPGDASYAAELKATVDLLAELNAI